MFGSKNYWVSCMRSCVHAPIQWSWKVDSVVTDSKKKYTIWCRFVHHAVAKINAICQSLRQKLLPDVHIIIWAANITARIRRVCIFICIWNTNRWYFVCPNSCVLRWKTEKTEKNSVCDTFPFGSSILSLFFAVSSVRMKSEFNKNRQNKTDVQIHNILINKQ